MVVVAIYDFWQRVLGVGAIGCVVLAALRDCLLLRSDSQQDFDLAYSNCLPTP